jgi:broad specificity phosphatase PhoE
MFEAYRLPPTPHPLSTTRPVPAADPPPVDKNLAPNAHSGSSSAADTTTGQVGSGCARGIPGTSGFPAAAPSSIVEPVTQDRPADPAAGPVTVFLVRHGETPMHAENRYVGRTDAPLTERGHSQAADLGEWAATAGLTAVASSTLRRAKETAEPAARKAGLTQLLDERLVELDFGAAEGLSAVQMRERFPQERTAFEDDPYANSLPGGESPAAALARGRAALEELADGSHGDRVLVVAHGTLLRIVVCDLLGIHPRAYRTALPVIRNASGAVLRRDPAGHWGLVAWNPPLAAGTDTW